MIEYLLSLQIPNLFLRNEQRLFKALKKRLLMNGVELSGINIWLNKREIVIQHIMDLFPING